MSWKKKKPSKPNVRPFKPDVAVATDDSHWQSAQPSGDPDEDWAEINSYYLRK